MDSLSETQKLIVQECDKIKEMLLEKNRKYGDSAITPKRIFSKADPVEQINVRIDDKLSRIQSGQIDETEDVELDLIGYLVLKRVALKFNAKTHETQDLFSSKSGTIKIPNSVQISNHATFI